MDPVVSNLLTVLGIALFAYFFGGIPTAVIIGKLFYGKNPLEYGSHNSGGTNAGRVLGKKAGILVIVLDILKTAAVFWTTYAVINFTGLTEAAHLWNDGLLYNWLALFFASLGHCFSPYLKGKGGKAVACLYGSVGGTSWVLFPLCFVSFFLFFKLTKKVMSKASILTGAFLVSLEWMLCIISLCLAGSFSSGFLSLTFASAPGASFGWESALSTTLVYLLLVTRHADNIRRIKSGNEKPLVWEK